MREIAALPGYGGKARAVSGILDRGDPRGIVDEGDDGLGAPYGGARLGREELQRGRGGGGAEAAVGARGVPGRVLGLELEGEGARRHIGGGEGDLEAAVGGQGGLGALAIGQEAPFQGDEAA